MLKKIFFMGTLVLALLLSGCAKTGDVQAMNQNTQEEAAVETQGTYQTIDSAAAKEMMDSQTDAVILDVRDEDEYAEKHIEGSILIPNDEVEAQAAEKLPKKDAVILIYCQSGFRAKSAAKKLVKQGYTNVYNFGGIEDWPYETVSGS